MPTIALYVPAQLWRAHGEDATAVRAICIASLWADQPAPESWPEKTHVAPPSAAEKEWATGDPIPEPEDLKPTKLFAPVVPDTPETVAVKAKAARAVMDMAEEHFRPDPKPGKKR